MAKDDNNDHNIDNNYDDEDDDDDNDNNNNNNSKHKRLTAITANNTSCSELHTFGIRRHVLSKRLELTAQ